MYMSFFSTEMHIIVHSLDQDLTKSLTAVLSELSIACVNNGGFGETAQ